MTTLEFRSIDDEDVEDFIAHLYFVGIEISVCGIPESQDAHSVMHQQYGARLQVFHGPIPNSCPICEAKICPTCKAVAERVI